MRICPEIPLIGHVRCINIHTLLRGFMVKREYCLNSLEISLETCELNRTESLNLTIKPCLNIDISNGWRYLG